MGWDTTPEKGLETCLFFVCQGWIVEEGRGGEGRRRFIDVVLTRARKERGNKKIPYVCVCFPI